MAIPLHSFSLRLAPSCWQRQLRQSVRLYLALGSQPVNPAELEALLQSTEQELVDYLLQGTRPSAESVAQARHLVDLAQHRLLNSEADVEQLLREVLATEQREVLATEQVA